MHDVFQTRCGFEIDGHPCPKPVAWALWLCKRAAQAGEIVIDPFMGSGTTGVACIKTGRKFIGIEKEPKYFEIAVKRIEAARDEQSLFVPPEPRHNGHQLQLQEIE